MARAYLQKSVVFIKMSVLCVSGFLLGAKYVAASVTDKILFSGNIYFSEENRFKKNRRKEINANFWIVLAIINKMIQK